MRTGSCGTISYNGVDLRTGVVSMGQGEGRVAHDSHSVDLGSRHRLS